MLAIMALIGLAVAVPVNILADILPARASGQPRPWQGPSCRYCGEGHHPAWWLATAAYLFREGRCEHCSAPRPIRPVVVELALALGFSFLYDWSSGDLSRFTAAAVIATVFALIAVIDIEHRLILRAVSLPALVLFAAIGILMPDRGAAKTLWGGLGGFGLTLGLYLFGLLFSWTVARLRSQPLDEIAFGGGDVNLGALVGLVVGWPGVIVALVLAVAAAGVYSALFIAAQILRRRYNPYAAIPYGPFLILGAMFIYLYGKQFAAWYAGL